MFGKPYNAKADLFSVGVIAYVCLMTKVPYRATGPAELMVIYRKRTAFRYAKEQDK